MKLHHYLFIGWGLLTSLTACKHEQQLETIIPSPDQPEQSGTVTEVGQPQGTPTHKTIGPEGGSIATQDGNVRLVIPAGAVSKATDISIQAVTNTNATGLAQAYRFLPEGLQFSAPATLTFRYSEKQLSSQDTQNLKIAYQHADGIWYDVDGSSVDPNAHEISVPMNHFSDWTPYEVAQLKFTSIGSKTVNGTEYVDFGESIPMYVSLNTFLESYPKNKKEKPLVLKKSSRKGTNWKLFGDGKLEMDEGGQATYTAPTTAPKQNPVLVTADLEFEGKSFRLTLFCQIYVGSGTFFNMVINGKTIEGRDFSCARVAGKVIFGNSVGPYSAGWFIEANDITERDYAFNECGKETANTVEAAYALLDQSDNGYGFHHYYSNDCDYKCHVSTGALRIDKLETINGIRYVTGSVNGVFYRTQGFCNKGWRLEQITYSGAFRMQVITAPIKPD